MKCALGILAIALLLFAACGSPAAQQPAPAPTPGPAPTPAPDPAEPACASKDCFIPAANNCDELSATLTTDAGTFRFSSSKDCVLTKTFVTAAPGESQEIKTLLEGKSMTCTYVKGSFDSRLVTGLVFGSERCEGQLKDALAQLLLFA